VVLRVPNFDTMLELISSSSAHGTLLGYWNLQARFPRDKDVFSTCMCNDLSASCE
jgi:hypothetical protein